MAADYWASTQARFWTFTHEQLTEMRKSLKTNNVKLHNMIRLPDDRLVSIYIQQQIIKLGRKLSIRQQALATAQIYIRRFYTRTELRRTNPYLLIATAVYLACKTEECPVHIKSILSEATKLWPDTLPPPTSTTSNSASISGASPAMPSSIPGNGLRPTEVSTLGECEFVLISTLRSQLVLHHPYRVLSALRPQMGLGSEEMALARCVINDHYNTDIALVYAPHIVAFAAVFLTVSLRAVKGGSHSFSSSGSSASTSTGTGSGSLSGLYSGLGSAMGALAGTGLAGLKTDQNKLNRLVEFFAASHVNMEQVIVVTQEIICLYDVWELYSEKPIREAFARIVKEGAGSGLSG